MLRRENGNEKNIHSRTFNWGHADDIRRDSVCLYRGKCGAEPAVPNSQRICCGSIKKETVEIHTADKNKGGREKAAGETEQIKGIGNENNKRKNDTTDSRVDTGNTDSILFHKNTEHP